jgi:hypothetical protein
MEKKYFLIISSFCSLFFACASTGKPIYDLNEEGLNNLINYYKNNEFVYFTDDIRVSQQDIDFSNTYILQDIFIDNRNKPKLCTLSFVNNNGEIKKYEINVEYYTSAYDRGLAEKYCLCLVRNYYGGGYHYYAMDIHNILNITPYKFTGLTFQNIETYDNSIFAKGFHLRENISNIYNEIQKRIVEQRIKNDKIREIIGEGRIVPMEHNFNISNPYSYDKNVIYYSASDYLYVHQWLEIGFIASFLPEEASWQMPYNSQFYIRNTYNITSINYRVSKTYIKYIGTQTFTRGNGSGVILPVFDLLYYE